ncbi:MAG: helix-turn-helix domain-containing protein [Anaerolineae bacterium]|jgi:AraC-like DNA-binding protein|nr:helix-turn-helix domain-containing protein [Anaerolineae bacterium]
MYQLHLPIPPLRPYIENYWILKTQSSDMMPLQEAIFVDGRADILFNFGVAYQRGHPHLNSTPIPFSNVDAQRTYPVSIHQTGAIHLIGVRFRVGGLAPFIPHPLYQLSDSVISTSDIFGRAIDELESKLYEAQLIDQIVLLDAFFMQSLRLRDSYRMVMDITRKLVSPDKTIQQISHDVGYSIRSIDRFFRDDIGFSPKFYARILRIERAIQLMMTASNLTMIELALQLGYYDQAHFSKEFKDFTGQTPIAYRAQLLQKLPNPAPNLVQFLQE